MTRFLCILILTFSLGSVALAAEPATLKEAQVRKIVTDYVVQKTGLPVGAITVKRLGFSGEVPLPSGTPSFEVVSPQEWEGWGRGALALIVRIDERVVKNIPLNVEVEALGEVVVATRPLERGMVVGKRDVAMEKRDLAALPARSCRSLDEAIGKEVRVGMRANAPLRSDYLERPALVKSGQLVTIVAENERFRVTATGRARGNGAEGERVPVQNLNAQKEIAAVVVDANTVRVEF